MEPAALLDELPPDRRLALAYAPAATRADCLAVFSLDLRLSRLLAQQREPMLTQMRLAWWRDRLSEEATGFHHDEPVLALLAPWGAQRAQLTALVDSWEALLAEPPLADFAVRNFAQGRAAAFTALAERAGAAGQAEEAARAGFNWALADLAAHISDPEELAVVKALIQTRDWSRPRIGKHLRPLALLHGLAARQRGNGALLGGIRDGLAAIRLGLLGR